MILEAWSLMQNQEASSATHDLEAWSATQNFDTPLHDVLGGLRALCSRRLSDLKQILFGHTTLNITDDLEWLLHEGDKLAI